MFLFLLCSICRLINFSLSSAGSDHQTVNQPILDQLSLIGKLAPTLKVLLGDLFKKMCPKVAVPTTTAEFLAKMQKLGTYFNNWRLSACRLGASRALALVKAHYPTVDLARVCNGRPAKHQDQSEFTSKDFNDLIVAVRGPASKLAGALKMDNFIPPYDMDGKQVSLSGKGPSMSTPNPPEPTPSTQTAGDSQISPETNT